MTRISKTISAIEWIAFATFVVGYFAMLSYIARVIYITSH